MSENKGGKPPPDQFLTVYLLLGLQRTLLVEDAKHRLLIRSKSYSPEFHAVLDLLHVLAGGDGVLNAFGGVA